MTWLDDRLSDDAVASPQIGDEPFSCFANQVSGVVVGSLACRFALFAGLAAAGISSTVLESVNVSQDRSVAADAPALFRRVDNADTTRPLSGEETHVRTPRGSCRMSLRIVIATVVVLGLAAAAWFYRSSAPLAGAAKAVGISTESSTPPTGPSLKAAGVHKCVGPEGTSYIAGACPRGTRETVANGGTMTVKSFPKPAPSPSSLASSVLGGPLLKPVDPEERDRLRDKAIEDAANRR
jgi:hypothetical protein